MTTRLVILGILRQQPLHGYEIKQIIEEHMGDWTSIAFGSIYFALAKLSEEGLIEKIGEERKGNRPSRSIYQITDTGRDEFTRLLREVWAEVERTYYSIDVGLFFLDALPRDEVRAYLEQRVKGLEQTMQYLDRHQGDQMSNPEVPKVAEAIFAHTRAHSAAELEWTRTLLAQLVHKELD
jgi:DNA-binding PadR family transcriptional regulator